MNVLKFRVITDMHGVKSCFRHPCTRYRVTSYFLEIVRRLHLQGLWNASRVYTLILVSLPYGLLVYILIIAAHFLEHEPTIFNFTYLLYRLPTYFEPHTKLYINHTMHSTILPTCYSVLQPSFILFCTLLNISRPFFESRDVCVFNILYYVGISICDI